MNVFFKSGFRSLWRQRLFTILNIFGLAISISACWMIFRIVSHEFSYDRSLPDKENIYKVITTFNSPDRAKSKMAGVAAPLYTGIREEISGVAMAVPVFRIGLNSIEIKNGEKLLVKDAPEDVVATDASYFDMIPYKWISGSKTNALLHPNKVVLTESRAREYFPKEEPEDMLNNTITYYEWGDTISRSVSGIVADYQSPTQFTANEFVSLPSPDFEAAAWTNTNGSDQLFIRLNTGASATVVLQQINGLSARKWKDFETGIGKEIKMSKSYALLPVKEVHFATDVSEYGVSRTSKPVMYGLLAIGLFLLLLACINYINMSVAQIPQRGKEIGVRKTLGSSRGRLIGQFLLETFLTTAFACIFSVFLSKAGFHFLRDIIPAGVTLYSSLIQAILFMVLLSACITFLAGMYPAWLITRMKAISIFRNFSFTGSSRKGFSLQKALIVFQFFIALLFITGSIIVGSQLRYTLKADMGFNKDAVVLVSVPWKYLDDERYRDKQFTLLTQIKNIAGVEMAALGAPPLSSGYASSPFIYETDGKEAAKVQTYKKWGDTSYLNLYEMEFLAGRNLRASDTISEYVINETAARAFGFASPQDAVGKMIAQLGNTRVPIVGVVKDFNTQDFYTKVTPVAISGEKTNLNVFNVRLNGYNSSQWQQTLKAIEKQWYHFYPPESFHVNFFDETIEKMYLQEMQISRLIDLATIITIFISCLGLFGLAALTAFRRTKEIGIRKVLGASVSSIVTMFSREYVVLIIIALLISTPIAWWALNTWLNDFAYRIEIQWWMFVLAGIIAMAVALITVSFQAIKAALANPVEAIRTE